MDKTQIRETLKNALQQVYDLRTLSSLMEFCQGELRVLMYLKTRGSEANPSQLSEALNVTRARITSVLTSLRRKGYIEMNISPEDRRKMSVTLTEEGSAYVCGRTAMADAYVDAFIDKIGAENSEQLAGLLKLTAQRLASEN